MGERVWVFLHLSPERSVTGTIFYMASERTVEIVRILHQQMDHAGRLGLL